MNNCTSRLNGCANTICETQQFWICTIWFSNKANAFVLASDIIVQIQNVPQYCTVAGQILYLNDLIVDDSHADGAQRFRGGSNTELLCETGNDSIPISAALM